MAGGRWQVAGGRLNVAGGWWQVTGGWCLCHQLVFGVDGEGEET